MAFIAGQKASGWIRHAKDAIGKTVIVPKKTAGTTDHVTFEVHAFGIHKVNSYVPYYVEQDDWHYLASTRVGLNTGDQGPPKDLQVDHRGVFRVAIRGENCASLLPFRLEDAIVIENRENREKDTDSPQDEKSWATQAEWRKFVTPLFGREFVMPCAAGSDGVVTFYVDGPAVMAYHAMLSPRGDGPPRWHFVSDVYWGQGYHSELQVNDDGHFRVNNT